jgi:putative sigma-54 modulation protein
MNVKIQSIKFDADKKLIDFIEKKVSKLDKFFDGIIGTEVFLRVENTQNLENKKAEIRLAIPGNDLFAERVCKTFEEAIDSSIEALKIQMQKAKEKMRTK